MRNAAVNFGVRLCVLIAVGVGGSGHALAEFLELPADDIAVVGVESVAIAGTDDTLADIARQYDIGHLEIRLANPEVGFWLPGEGTRVQIPSRYVLPKADRKGLVLNIPEMRLYYFAPASGKDSPGMLITHPVSIGRMDWATPLGGARITTKVRNPSWVPPKSIHQEAAEEGESLPAVVPPGPDNPLGEYALKLNLPGYLLHGTNRPYGVGMRVTHGCIRMYPEDIEGLFERVPVGTPVMIVNQPVKVGWAQDGLYLEVHPTLEEDERTAEDLKNIAVDLLEQAAGEGAGRISGRTLMRALEEQSGMPVRVARKRESEPGTVSGAGLRS